MIMAIIIIIIALLPSSSPRLQWRQLPPEQLGRGRSLYGLPDAAIELPGVHRSYHGGDDDGDGGHGTLAFAVAGVASLVVAGLFMCFRMRRSSSPVYTDQSMVSLE